MQTKTPACKPVSDFYPKVLSSRKSGAWLVATQWADMFQTGRRRRTPQVPGTHSADAPELGPVRRSANDPGAQIPNFVPVHTRNHVGFTAKSLVDGCGVVKHPTTRKLTHASRSRSAFHPAGNYPWPLAQIATDAASFRSRESRVFLALGTSKASREGRRLRQEPFIAIRDTAHRCCVGVANPACNGQKRPTVNGRGVRESAEDDNFAICCSDSMRPRYHSVP
jgi:hypothetical protein